MDLPVHELPEPKAPTGDFMIVVDEGEGLLWGLRTYD
jgi:hypothetical protein